MEDLQRQINELSEKIAKLENSATIPLPVDRAFRDRFGITTIIKKTAILDSFINSSKNATSENITVNEGGADVKDVLGIPDDFIQVTLADGSTYYLAAWTS